MTRRPSLLMMVLATLPATTLPATLAAQEDGLALRRGVSVQVERWEGRAGELDPAELHRALESYDHARAAALEALYRDGGDGEKRLLERRFGLIDHRFRVSASPAGIYAAWERSSEDPALRRAALSEIAAGRYAAYYFFDGVIRPNVFAHDRALRHRESPVHEKVHLIQPALYRALGLTCGWRARTDPCVRSVEPVAVYLTEYALLKRIDPHRSDVSVNRAIERYLALEERRCRVAPVPRCPSGQGLEEYVTLPQELARRVERHGLEEGLRRFVRGLAGEDVELARSGR